MTVAEVQKAEVSGRYGIIVRRGGAGVLWADGSDEPAPGGRRRVVAIDGRLKGGSAKSSRGWWGGANARGVVVESQYAS